jgi:hypothetical protein
MLYDYPPPDMHLNEPVNIFLGGFWGGGVQKQVAGC